MSSSILNTLNFSNQLSDIRPKSSSISARSLDGGSTLAGSRGGYYAELVASDLAIHLYGHSSRFYSVL